MLVATRRRLAAPFALAMLTAAALALMPYATAAQEPTLVATGEHDIHGTILTTADGMTLYTTTHAAADVDLDVWQPLTVALPADVTADPAITGEFGTIATVDGPLQVTFDGAGLYTFTGDVQAGDAAGHGLDDGAWAVVAAQVDVEAEGEFTVEPVAGGLQITQYTGTLATLEADGAAHDLVTAFATVDGEFVGYTFGAPAFVNAQFVATFEAGFESEGMIVLAN